MLYRALSLGVFGRIRGFLHGTNPQGIFLRPHSGSCTRRCQGRRSPAFLVGAAFHFAVSVGARRLVAPAIWCCLKLTPKTAAQADKDTDDGGAPFSGEKTFCAALSDNPGRSQQPHDHNSPTPSVFAEKLATKPQGDTRLIVGIT
jgi:hypothetical protein